MLDASRRICQCNEVVNQTNEVSRGRLAIDCPGQTTMRTGFRTIGLTVPAFLLFFLANFNASAGPTSCVAPPSGLVGWWPGEGNAKDIIGTNNGVLVNGTTFAAGVVGQAFSFD